MGLLYTGSLWYGEALKQVSNVASRTDSQQPTHSNNRSDTPLHSAAVFQSITKVTTIILNNNHCTMLTSINFKDQHAGDKVVLSAFRCVSFFCVAFLDALRRMFKFDKKHYIIFTLHNYNRTSYLSTWRHTDESWIESWFYSNNWILHALISSNRITLTRAFNG